MLSTLEQGSNLAKVIFRRTYARSDYGYKENFDQMIERVIRGNIQNYAVPQEEINKLEFLMKHILALPAGRGLWFSGSPAHQKLGSAAEVNCWGTTSEYYENFIMSMDLLMLGGGVGMSVEQRFTSKLSKIKKDVVIRHTSSKDADFIVPDSREGWCELVRRVFESWFVTGKSFTYSTICVRGYGEKIVGFGGTASGPIPLVECVENLCKVFSFRQGKSARPVDCADFLCIIAAMVVAGNVRRSALMILGDPWDKDFLKIKRWDLGNIPEWRSNANFSIVIDDPEDFHPLYWKTYEVGEAFGIFNRKATQTFGRMGERKKDTAQVVNPCAEATLEDGEPCNIQDLFMSRLKSEEDFVMAGRMMHRYGKRVTLGRYHNPKNDEVVKRNRRIGTGITGCLQSSLFTPSILDHVYDAIQDENRAYSKELGIPESIRTTVVKPSGTLSILGDCTAGIHAAYSRYIIRTVRLASNDDLVGILKEAGHRIEPKINLDGTYDHKTQVADFYLETPEGVPCADEGFDMWKQIEAVQLAQKHWADQAVSCSIYYKKEDISKIKEWLTNNLKDIKTISFLCHNDHGFKQAPLQAITKEQYEKGIERIKPLNLDRIVGDDLESMECSGGVCPIK